MAIYSFKNIITYEVEADSLIEAEHLRDEIEDSTLCNFDEEKYDGEELYFSSWIHTNTISDEELNARYVLTDKGRDYLLALEGKCNFDVANYNSDGSRKTRLAKYPTVDIEPDFDYEDAEDRFYDYLTED